VPLKAINCPQQRTDSFGFDNRRPVSNRRGDQRAAQVCGRIPFSATRCNGEAEYGTNSATRASGCFVSPALLDLSQRIKDFWRLDFRDRPLAEFLVGEIKQPLSLLQRFRGIALCLGLVHEFFGYGFKSVGSRHSGSATLFLAVDGGVDPFGKQLLGIIALDARVCERRDRILAQREQLLLGVKVVGVAPEL